MGLSVAIAPKLCAVSEINPDINSQQTIIKDLAINAEFNYINSQLKIKPYEQNIHNHWYQVIEALNPDLNRLALLNQFITNHPLDSLLYQDYITQLSWHDHHVDALKLYRSTSFSQPQAFMIRAVANSAKLNNDLILAEHLYLDLIRKNETDNDAIIGLFSTWNHMNNPEKVIARNTELPNEIQLSPQIIRLVAAAHQKLDQQSFAAMLLSSLLVKHPNDSDLYIETTNAINFAGMPEKAFAMMIKKVEYFDDASKQSIWSSHNTFHTRRAIHENNQNLQIKLAQKALEINDNYIQFIQQINTQQRRIALNNAQADRLVLLNLLNQHEQVVEYFAEDEAAHLPNYALNVVSGSLLALQKPNQAQELIDSVLENDPENYDALILAYFAHIEDENFDDAESYLLRIEDSQPTWLFTADRKRVQNNYKESSAALMKIMHIAYKNQVPEAREKLHDLIQESPENNEFRIALANLNRWYGEYELSRNDQQQVRNTDKDYQKLWVAEFNLMMAEREYPEAKKVLENMKATYPLSDDIVHMDKLWNIYHSNELSIDGLEQESKGTRFSGREDRLKANFLSQPLKHHWRLVAHKSHQHVDLPNNTKAILNQSGVGVDFQKRKLSARLQQVSTENHQGSDWRFDFGYKVNNHWSFNLNTQTFSDQTPIRAFNAGITGKSVGLGVQHQFDERYQHALSWSRLKLDDENSRTQFNFHANQQLFRNEHHLWILHENLYWQGNSLNNNRPYFNPKSFKSITIGINYQGILKRHYDRYWMHEINGTTGLGHQKGFSHYEINNIEYTHKYFINAFVNIYAGLGYASRYFDGDNETGPFYKAGLEYRF